MKVRKVPPYKPQQSLLDILSACKRAKSMGKYHNWQPCYDTHYLASCLSNYAEVIEGAMLDTERDWQFILHWYYLMCTRINTFCDNNKVAGDEAAEYWLEWFVTCRQRLWLNKCYTYDYVFLGTAFGLEGLRLLEVEVI
jgi:hypothetical protein